MEGPSRPSPEVRVTSAPICPGVYGSRFLMSVRIQACAKRSTAIHKQSVRYLPATG
jgi:hypothetical protein